MLERILICLTLLFGIVGTGCIHDERTIYEAITAYPDGNGYKLVLAKSPIFYWFVATAPVKSSDFYTAHGVVEDGRMLIDANSAHLLESAGSNWKVRFVPIEGTDDWIQLPRETAPGLIYKFSGPRFTRREIASFHFAYRDTATCALAISQSGKHLLIAGPDAVQLWDVEAEKYTTPPDVQFLSDVRKKLIDSRGWPGHWYLTDDCRYVVVLPPNYRYLEGSVESSGAADVEIIAGVSIEIQQQGIMFDRQSSRITPATKIQADGTRARREVVGVTSDEGKLLLLYLGGNALWHGREQLTAVSMDGQEIGRCEDESQSPIDGSSLNLFDPSGNILMFHPTLWIGGPEATLWQGNWRSGGMQPAFISTSMVSRGIDGK